MTSINSYNLLVFRLMQHSVETPDDDSESNIETDTLRKFKT